MATPRARSSTPPNRTVRFDGTKSKTSTKYSFHIQSAPPLSIQQYLRSTSGVREGAKDWKPSGIYRPPAFHDYVPPIIRERKKPVEPVWHPPGRYQEKPPTSLSPERIVPKYSPEPVWHPPGKTEHKPVPYFDPPNLRWSLRELLQSMPELRPQSSRASSRSLSKTRQSIDAKDAQE